MQERNLWSQVSFRWNWNLEMLVFEKRGKPRSLRSADAIPVVAPPEMRLRFAG